MGRFKDSLINETVNKAKADKIGYWIGELLQGGTNFKMMKKAKEKLPDLLKDLTPEDIESVRRMANLNSIAFKELKKYIK